MKRLAMGSSSAAKTPRVASIRPCSSSVNGGDRLTPADRYFVLPGRGIPPGITRGPAGKREPRRNGRSARSWEWE